MLSETKLNNKNMPKKFNPIWLIAEGEYAVVKIEVDGKWIEIIRERLDSPFSHIVESLGIERTVTEITK